MWDLWSIIAALFFLYCAFCLLRWTYETTRKLLVRLWAAIDPRPEAHTRRRFQRIARRIDDKNAAISRVMVEETRVIDDILRR